ncbi:hypothetical protein ACJMK2_019231 [Sinanodonta woodiana]|uniref:B box-type domain-containing protein n=1 Tax=Sinanodonta woodiana TaxID=1069815 RepID=A0ABD3UH77_SINWO
MDDLEDYIKHHTVESTVPSSVPRHYSNRAEIDHSAPHCSKGTIEVEHHASLPVQFIDLSDGDDKVPFKEEANQYTNMQPTIAVEDIVKKATSGTNFCSLHVLEKFEESIVCATCEELICPLCMRDQHRKHQILSLNAVTEFHAARNALQERAEKLANYQKIVSDMHNSRVQHVAKIQMSTSKISQTIKTSIEELIADIIEKYDEIVAYISNYEESCLKKLFNELETLQELENLANPLCKTVNASLRKLDSHWNAQYTMLEEKVEEACQKCGDSLSSLPSISPETITLPEEKFSKVAHSIVTFKQICGKLHPEVTNIIVLNKVKVTEELKKCDSLKTPDSMVETAKKIQQLEPIEMERNFTKIIHVPYQRQPTQQVDVFKKKDGKGVKSVYENNNSKQHSSVRERILEGYLPQHREFKLVSFDILSIEKGCGVMIKTGSWFSAHIQILIGKLTNIGITEESQTDPNIFTIRIFNDPLKIKKFEFAQDRIIKEICSSNEIVCHFRLDQSGEMSNELYRELVSLKNIASFRMFDSKFLSGSMVRENCLKLPKLPESTIVQKVTPNNPRKSGELVEGYMSECGDVHSRKKVDWTVYLPDSAVYNKLSASTPKRSGGGIPIVHEESKRLEKINKPSQNTSVTNHRQVLMPKYSATSTTGKPDCITVSLAGENQIEHKTVKIEPDLSDSTRKRKGGIEPDQSDNPRKKISGNL